MKIYRNYEENENVVTIKPQEHHHNTNLMKWMITSKSLGASRIRQAPPSEKYDPQSHGNLDGMIKENCTMNLPQIYQ